MDLRLDDDGYDVAGDEDPCIPSRSDSREL